MAGDFGLVAKSYESGAAEFVQRLGLTQGTRVLDVACGTGSLALPAARAGADVTGVDIAPNLVEQARRRAAAEGLRARFDEGDAEALPYSDGTFDAVISMFGVMFAPRQELAANELLRVCRKGGRIALANWTPAGFAGQMFRIIAGYVPPPTGVPSPLQWGDPSRVRDLLGHGTSDLRTAPRLIAIEYGFPPADIVAHMRRYFGPMVRAFDSLAADPAKQAALQADLERLWTQNNKAAAGATRVESEYLEVLATRA
jgi:SAM-dependent methyltransferase